MSLPHNLRSIEEIRQICGPILTEVGNEKLSSDEDSDHVEELTDFSSEEDASNLEASDESESESENEEQQRVLIGKKRGRPTSRGTSMSRCGKKPSVIRGQDGYQWYSTEQEKIPHSENQVSCFLPGPVGEARDVASPLEAWSLLLNDTILKRIVLHTNEEISRYRDSIKSENSACNIYGNIELQELKAFIGLLYFSGLQKTCSTNTDDLWSVEYGSQMYRATMPQRRYLFLSRVIRFDDKNTRPHRREVDKFAPIRELWETFVSNCTKFYTPTSYCTIFEHLVSFRGRCPFKVYNGSKPEKYGIKIVMLNDSHTFYMYTAEPYVGRVMTQPGESVPSYYVRKLSEPLHGTSRNLTCDNWFSSVEIFDRMLQDHSLTMVGNLRKNNRQIPDSFRKAGPVLSTRFAFDGTKTLLSYTPKKNKIVLFLSTFHHTPEIDQESRKPEIVKFYNSTKGGTDTFDQMCHEYTTTRKTSRWPMRVWFGMLDLAAINAMVLYNFNANNKLFARRQFLKTLVKSLIEPHLCARLQIGNLRRNLRSSIEEILGIDPIVLTNRPFAKQARCAFCPRSDDRKSRTACTNCQRAICEAHRALYCPLCDGRD